MNMLYILTTPPIVHVPNKMQNDAIMLMTEDVLLQLFMSNRVKPISTEGTLQAFTTSIQMGVVPWGHFLYTAI